MLRSMCRLQFEENTTFLIPEQFWTWPGGCQRLNGVLEPWELECFACSLFSLRGANIFMITIFTAEIFDCYSKI